MRRNVRITLSKFTIRAGAPLSGCQTRDVSNRSNEFEQPVDETHFHADKEDETAPCHEEFYKITVRFIHGLCFSRLCAR